MTKRSLRRPNPRGKRPRGERRAMPTIFVALPEKAQLGLGTEARAHIRTRRGGYRYLVWREGGQVRELYLGKVRNSCPTPASRSGTSSPAPAPRSAARRVGQRKRGRK